MSIKWKLDISDTVTYEVEKYVPERIVFNDIDSNAAAVDILKNMDAKIQKKIRRLCGGKYILPFSIDINDELRCFGVPSCIYFIASAHGKCPEEYLSGCVITGSVPNDVYVGDIFEASENQGRLTLLRIPDNIVAALKGVMKRKNNPYAYIVAHDVMDTQFDYSSFKLPSGRNFKYFC